MKVEKYLNDFEIKLELSNVLNIVGCKEEVFEMLFIVFKKDLNYVDVKLIYLEIIVFLFDGDVFVFKYCCKLYSILY